MSRDEELSGAQAVQDISSAMLKAAGECLKVHGNDPTAPAILAAAFCMAMNGIDRSIDPTFSNRVMQQMSARS